MKRNTMNTMARDIPNQGQYAKDLSFKSEMEINMSDKSDTFIGDSRKMNHNSVVMPKVIKSTALTERRDESIARPNIAKNYSSLPKSYNDPVPNDAGQPVYGKLFKKAAPRGEAKGGIKYGK